MEVKLSENALAGFEYVAMKEGKTALVLVNERAELQGLAYFEDKKRGDVQDLFVKVEKNPEAYRASIVAIATVEEQKEADEKALKEAEELIKEPGDIKGV